MECSCFTGGDYEYASIFHTFWVKKTSKESRCCECGEQVPKGSRVHKIDILFDGEWNHFTTCHICAKIRSDFYCNGYAPGTLKENLSYDLEVDL
jgi:hypothetical protein